MRYLLSARVSFAALVIFGAVPFGVPQFGLLSECVAAESLSSNAAVETALRQNRELRAAEFLVAEAKGRLTQVKLLANPEVELKQQSDTAFADEGEYEFTAALRQKFPVSGRLRLQKAVARVDVALAEAEIRDRKRLLIAEVQQRYNALLLVGRKEQLNRALLASLAELVAVSERRFKLAEISQFDLNLEKLELERLRLAESDLEIEKLQGKIELNRLLGRPPAQPFSLDSALPPPLSAAQIESAIEQALSRRPDVAALRLQIDRAHQETRLASAERWEDWTVGVEYTRDKSVFAEPIGTEGGNFLGFSVAVPLPLWNQNQGRIAEAAAQKLRAQAELEALELRIVAEAHASAAKLVALAPNVKRFESSALPLAQKNLQSLRASYSQGVVGLTQILQAQQQLVTLNQSYLGLLNDLTTELVRFTAITASAGAEL